MKKKIICAILVTALAVTSFTGCGKAQDKDTAEVIMAETETRDPDITAEAQAAVDTLLPTETGKPVVTETATPTPKPVATKEPETTATPKAAATAKPKATATAKPKATATPKPATTAGSGTTVAAGVPAPVRLVHPQQQQSRYQPRHRQQRPQLPHRHQYPLRPLVIIIMSRNIGRLHLLVTAVEIGLWSALSVGM